MSPTVGALVAEVVPQENKTYRKANSKKCVYCDGKHEPENCEKISTVEARLAVLIHRRKYFNRFGGNHTSKSAIPQSDVINVIKNTTLRCAKRMNLRPPRKTTRKAIKERKTSRRIRQHVIHTSLNHLMISRMSYALNHQVIQIQSAVVTVKAENEST